jgi:hypothetical protein
MAQIAKLVGENRGASFVPIKFEVADNLACCSATIPGKVTVEAEALIRSMTHCCHMEKAKTDEVIAPEIRYHWKR